MTQPNKLFELGMDALIEMYQLDATSIGGTIYRYTPFDLYGGPIVWQTLTYNPYPIVCTGFEMRANAAPPRPKLSVSNMGGFISSICRNTDDLIGAQVIRIRTLKKYLDAVNFGGSNPTADPTIEFPREIWRIDRRASETRDAVSFELAAPWDVNGVRLPRRIVIQGSCSWVYRSSECGYTGGAVATLADVVTTDINQDKCGKRVSSCKLRFGAFAELPFGGFPSVGQTSANT